MRGEAFCGGRIGDFVSAIVLLGGGQAEKAPSAESSLRSLQSYGMMSRSAHSRKQNRTGHGSGRKMDLRDYKTSDCTQLAELFYQTVHSVNAKDYTQAQLNAWATGEVDLAAWDASFLKHKTIGVVEGSAVVGFGDMDNSGYLDRLYVHKDYQRRGIAAAICDVLESAVPGKRITTHASITAKPFFLRRGYRVVKEQEVVRRGVVLTNFVMEKF